ncbi:hypothetical protein BDV97DRAFT_349919 [Delphinella strobiligena]|nr:hypothetical protein BDV97DRAFT_349919 [Delphinella strobiligena]
MPGIAAPKRAPRLAGLNNGRKGNIKGLSRPGKTNSPCGCENPQIEVIEGSTICMGCGTEISQNNIVAEVTFGETASGAAAVDGAHVGENQRFANTLGSTASRRVGVTTRSREDSEQNGREAIRVYTGKLAITQKIQDEAIHIWKLASNDGFIQGRRAEEVAGACLYAACRRDKENTVLLMDLAEIVMVNVFALGDIYKELAKKLYLQVGSRANLLEVEPLILKYASKLEFGEKTRQVAEDAVKIIRRMKRDWIVTGRHPAGLCGACIILAARMNNFRRTVREVVFVVKVADLTIAKRLEEFRRTRSSQLNINEFRTLGNRIKMQHDPPAMYEADERARKLLERKRKRLEYEQSKENTVDIPDDESNPASRQSSVAADNLDPQLAEHPQQASAQPEAQQAAGPARAKRRKKTTATAPARCEPCRDADGFVIPELPIDPLLLEAANAAAKEIENEDATAHPENAEDGDAVKKEKRKVGRPRKDRKEKEVTPAPTPLTEEELLAEEELQDEIENILRTDDCVSKSRDEIEREKLEERTKLLAEQQRAITTANLAQRAENEGRTHYVVPDSEIIGEDEFADDPEVMNALLTEEQVKVKEMIWVMHNEDWLRAQQTKQLKRALDEAEGKHKDKIKRKKRSRMGDGSVLEGGTPVESPADANRRMLEKRAPKQFSQRINYAALGNIYGHGTPAASERGSEAGTPAPESREGSVAPSETGLGTPPPTQQETSGDKEQPEEDDYEEEEDEDDAAYWNADEEEENKQINRIIKGAPIEPDKDAPNAPETDDEEEDEPPNYDGGYESPFEDPPEGDDFGLED